MLDVGHGLGGKRYGGQEERFSGILYFSLIIEIRMESRICMARKKTLCCAIANVERGNVDGLLPRRDSEHYSRLIKSSNTPKF